MDHSNDQHGRNNLLATYVYFQACVPQESRAYGPMLQRPLSIPPQRKHRSTSHPDAHANLESLGLDAEISGVLRSAERAGTPRGVQDPGSRLQKKCLHEEIALLWTMSNSAARDVLFSNAW